MFLSTHGHPLVIEVENYLLSLDQPPNLCLNPLLLVLPSQMLLHSTERLWFRDCTSMLLAHDEKERASSITQWQQ